MDVVSSKARSGLPSELLYADNYVAATMIQLGRHVSEWRADLRDKGQKVNEGKSRVMVCISGGKLRDKHMMCKKLLLSVRDF